MSNSRINVLIENENIGILSVTTGQLDIVKIPVVDAPDWIVPQALILAIEPYHERIWTYLWHGQDVAVFHLIPLSETPTHLVILESITDVHRVALQIKGEISYQSVRIADLKDAQEADYRQALETLYPNRPRAVNLDSLNTETTEDEVSEKKPNMNPLLNQPDFVFQPVMLNGEICVIPDLDTLSHFLVDLDS